MRRSPVRVLAGVLVGVSGGIRRRRMRGALATPPDLGSGVTAFDSRASDFNRIGRIAESGKATVLKTVVGVRASRGFESCILRWSLVDQAPVVQRLRLRRPKPGTQVRLLLGEL